MHYLPHFPNFENLIWSLSEEGGRDLHQNRSLREENIKIIDLFDSNCK
jgi:hypothetical protein